MVPDIVRQFCFYLYRHIRCELLLRRRLIAFTSDRFPSLRRERNIPEIQSMYEVSWAKLSDRYFKAAPWPSVQLIADAVDHDHVFCLLYSELYYRHLYARCQPDLRERIESWENYQQLFSLLLHSNVNMQLPPCWMWDMIDEFIYQFQSFCQYKSRSASSRSPDENDLLSKCEDKVFNVLQVTQILQALVDKSVIVKELEADGGASLLEGEGQAPGQSNVLRLLGYNSLVGLLKVHTLLGDYHTALKSLYPINPNDPPTLFAPKVTGCNINLFYYTGFSYLMLKRYSDAARSFNSILMYINLVKQYHVRSSSYDEILQRNEQMYALLAITVSLSPASIKLLDENVATQLRERNTDKMAKMAKGDLAVYEELVLYSAPRFITTREGDERARQQIKQFLAEVKSTQTHPLLKQYLVLYSSISLPKLSSLMDLDEDTLRKQLVCLKSKSYGLVWTAGAGSVDATSGTLAACSDIEFHLDVDPASGQEMVIVSETPAVQTRHHTDLLARHIIKFEEIIRDLEGPGTQPIPQPPSRVAAF